jgi:hypothetical protein
MSESSDHATYSLSKCGLSLSMPKATNSFPKLIRLSKCNWCFNRLVSRLAAATLVV